MNILYINWNCFGAEDAVYTLHELGHSITVIQLSEKSHTEIDESFIDLLGDNIKQNKIESIFSFNYFPTISEAAKTYSCKYISFIYDNPSIKAYDRSITNPCNYIFTFDSAMCEELTSKGVQSIYYAPIPVNTKRLSQVCCSNLDRKNYNCDISFVGSLYNEKHNFYDRLIEKTPNSYLAGYLDSLINCQLKVFGYNFMHECLSQEIINEMYTLMPFDIQEDSFTDLPNVYADYFLCRKLAYFERYNILDILSKYYNVHHYTYNNKTIIGNVKNKGSANYFSEMPKIFQCSKINLNITLRSIKNGIPLRAMDILGSGGFLLTNYQKDFLLHFEPDKDFVYYGSVDELLDKANYYSRHDSERERIAQNGYYKITQEHTYLKRFKEILKIVNV